VLTWPPVLSTRSPSKRTGPSSRRRILDTNLVAAVSFFNVAAQDSEAKRSGFLCALSSVAGDRGRQSVLGFWRLIMLLVRAIPERIFKRMRL
jgi:hypothetical protein